MVKSIVRGVLVAVLVCGLCAPGAFAAASGVVEGIIKDAQTGDALPGANVLIVKTSFGASTTVEGKYIVRNIPPGTYTMRATYIGYLQKEVTITVKEGQTLKQDFRLSAIGVEGEEVVVTAQATGQKEAVNQQLTALPIVNVVSRARIQELPDANAAESVGRLPGISLVRTGGEGSQVVIRGLSPQYNQVTIDGVELPSNVAAFNNVGAGSQGDPSSLGDRGANLSMISSNMLGGIEVTKAITPDMDATLIGGVVNFGLRKAMKTEMGTERDESWVPLAEIWAQGGYANLKNSYDNYRMLASLEKRFFDQSFGIFAQVSGEKRNLSSNNVGVSYVADDKTLGLFGQGDKVLANLTGLNLTDVYRERKRVGGTVVMDYTYEQGEISFMNFLSRSDTRESHRGESINPAGNYLYYNANDVSNELNVISNLLHLQHDFSLVRVDLKASHSYSESKNPEDLSFNFYQDNAGFANLGDVSKYTPEQIGALVKHDDTRGSLDGISTSTTISNERTLTGSLDLQSDFALTDFLSGKMKFGGMYQRRIREYDFDQSAGSQMYSGGGAVVSAIQAAYPNLIMNGGRISFANFSKDSYEYGEFLNGQYVLPYPIDINLMWDMLPIAKRTPSLEGYRVNVLGSAINDYDGHEDKSAVYGMVDLHLGQDLSIIPGIRYQNLATSYTAMRGMYVPGGIQGGDTTIGHSHGFWLPMVHVRYKPLDWLQFHFAYTNTLNYPDYSSITPRYLISTNSISYNNHRLKPAHSENLDLVVSVLSNEVGLVSVNGFKKRVEDLVFYSHEYLTDLSKYPDLPQGTTQLYSFDTYINNPIPIDLYGIEGEWQTHFWYLPQPFTGLVLNVNYTHIFSEASYPKSEIITTYFEDGTFTQVVNDTTYENRMINQPNDILNVSLGYDYMGFSLRVSYLFQDNIFKRPDHWFALRSNSAEFHRWDISVKQELPWFGMQLFFSIANVTGADDVDIMQKSGYTSSEQRYGMSADLGIRMRF